MKAKQIIYFLLSFIFIWNNLNAQKSTKVFENGSDKLIVYSDVPGLAPSEFYKIRVRSNATNNEWQESFCLISRSLWSEQEGGKEENSKKKYFDHLKDWSHTYTNIEMEGDVEIELSKVNGNPIEKAVVHPYSKGIATTIRDGKAYFNMEEPALVAIDIDGQMDDQDTGNGYNGPPIHTLSVFAHSIMDKPKPSEPSVAVVQAGEPLPEPETYEILYFGAGVHNTGIEFTVQSLKNYFIPGDAIVYGTFTNIVKGNGKNIKIYGVGTISGDSIAHPSYDPNYPASSTDPNIGTPWKPIGIRYSENVEVEGVCCANGAFHAIYLHETVGGKHTSVKWAKVLQWRQNGDGIGNVHLTEDCFIRTQDDGCYVKGDKRRNVFWNDANGGTFNLAGMPKKSKYSLVIEDNDVIYARNYRGKTIGSRIFSFRGRSSVNNVDVTFNRIRIEDKFVTLGLCHIFATSDVACLEFKGHNGGSISGGITFKNIRSASKNTTGYPETIIGKKSNLMSGFTFQNVVVDGSLIESLDYFDCTNQYVTDMTFNPAGLSSDVTLSELKVSGELVPDFSPEKEVYNIQLPPGTLNVPNVKTTTSHDGAGVETTHATAIPGSTTIKVTAADNVTIKTYVVNFTTSTDPINVASVSIYDCPTEKITVSKNYQLSATVYPFGATDRTVRWSSSDNSVASIDEISGLITAIAPGEAEITVTTTEGNFKDSCTIHTGAKPVSVYGVTVGDCPLSILQTGDKHQLTANIAPADATDKSVTWSSSNTKVATINADGVITAVSEGNSMITATTNDGSYTVDCVVAVADTTVNSIELTPNGVKVYPNPASDKLYFKFPNINEEREVKIFNTVGQLIYREDAVDLYKSVKVEKLKVNGLIFVQVITGQQVSTFKVIVKD